MTLTMAIVFHSFLTLVDTCVMFKSNLLYTHIWVVTDLIFKYCVYSNMYTLKIWQEHFDVHKKHNSQLTQKPHPPRYVNVSKHLFIVIVHMLLSNKMLYWHSYPYQNEASGDDDFGNNISKVFWSILILTF